MQQVIVAYCKTNEVDFENAIPLQFVGRRNRRLGFSNDIHILFLTGLDKLSSSYKASLQELGFKLQDVSSLYIKIEETYKPLRRFSEYGKNMFLRWLVMEEFFAGEAIIDYDGDIVFNEDSKVIAEILKGKTFVLQGCPAFTVVSNREWFRQYKEQIELFVQDIDGYCKRAWDQRVGWEVTFKTRWAGSYFSPLFAHDQDLISHLIHAGKLIQDPVEDIMRCLSDYIYFENPLFVHMYDDNFPYRYVRENGIDYFVGERMDGEVVAFKKRILFWHMQNCFNFYLAKYIFRKKFLPFMLFSRLPLHLSSQGWEDSLNKRASRFINHATRLNVYRYFFEKKDFSGIMNDKTWWKKGIFL